MKYKGVDIPPAEGKEWLLVTSDASKTLAHHLYQPGLEPNPWSLSRPPPKIDHDGNLWTFHQAGRGDEGQYSFLNLPSLELGAGFMFSYTLRIREMDTQYGLHMRTPFYLADGRRICLSFGPRQNGVQVWWKTVGNRGFIPFAPSTIQVGGKSRQIVFFYTPNSVRIFEDGSEVGSLTVGPELPLRQAGFGNILMTYGGMETLDVRNVYTMPIAFHPGPEISPFPAQDKMSMELPLNAFMEDRLAALWTVISSDPMTAKYENESLHITNTSGQYEFPHPPSSSTNRKKN
jgi:hypothetical protein